MSVVVDAAALLALLLAEYGGDVVLPVLRGSAMSAVNASECCSRAVERGATAAAVLAILQSYEINIVPFDLAQATDAADLRPVTRHLGLSLGDRACLALARSLRLPIYTSDRWMAKLDIGIDIRLIR